MAFSLFPIWNEYVFTKKGFRNKIRALLIIWEQFYKIMTNSLLIFCYEFENSTLNSYNFKAVSNNVGYTARIPISRISYLMAFFDLSLLLQNRTTLQNFTCHLVLLLWPKFIVLWHPFVQQSTSLGNSYLSQEDKNTKYDDKYDAKYNCERKPCVS